MSARAYWWAGVVLDLILLLPGVYMAMAAIEVADISGGSAYAVGVAALFCMLPVFCIGAPLAAWRARSRARPPFHLAALLATPWLYAGFLVMFLLYG